MFRLPTSLQQEIDVAVRAAFARSGIIELSVVARTLQRRNWSLNVAREDIEHRALHTALRIGAVVLFDSEVDSLAKPRHLERGHDLLHQSVWSDRNADQRTPIVLFKELRNGLSDDKEGEA